MRKFLASLKSKTINKLGYSQILKNVGIAEGKWKLLWVRREQNGSLIHGFIASLLRNKETVGQ